MDKERFVKILATMDYEVCQALGDMDGESEIVRVIRKYQRALIELADAKEAVKKVFSPKATYIC